MPGALAQVPVRPLPLSRFESVVSPQRWAAFQKTAGFTAARLRGHVVWNLNSTAAGGGVAEILASLIGYSMDGGVDARWLVVNGPPEFFGLTKRIHNNLHGARGDGGDLGDAEHVLYEQGLSAAADDLRRMVRAGDVVVLHDPQTAGLVQAARAAGARVVWRCHIGIDHPDPLAQRAWDFLHRYVAEAEAVIMSRRSFAWQRWARPAVCIVEPSIDAFSSKNVDLDGDAVRSILATAGVVQDLGPGGDAVTVRHRADMVETAPVPFETDLVVQVSRWDRLKDPAGVLEGFVRHVAPHCDAHLMLAGPQAVADDPESGAVLADVSAQWRALSDAMRARVHLAALSMADVDENALVVNALQRHAEVVVQKSLAEGFGLTVAEAMWKARAVVASRVGGIQDQVVDGESGILVDDPTDLEEFGGHVARLMTDAELRRRIGEAAHRRVVDEFLATRHLEQWAALVGGFLD